MRHSFIALAALPLVYGQGVILSAQGTQGSAASLALQVDTSASDANIISQSEIEANIVNECGRTLLGGNIDIGENTEEQLSAKTVTSVTKGGKVAVTISQGSSDGAGPYTCDLDLTSNGDGVSGRTNLTVSEAAAKSGIITLTVTMPTDLACVGASTGNVCTMRCFNSAAAGPFGGCVALKQTDITAKANTPDNIETAQTLEGILSQVQENQADLPATLQSNADSGSTEAEQGLAAVAAVLDVDSTAEATVAVAAATATAAATSTSTSTAKTGKTGNHRGAKNGNANANANGNANAKANPNANARAGGRVKNAKRTMRWGKRDVLPLVDEE